jgi:hypothetical protein
LTLGPTLGDDDGNGDGTDEGDDDGDGVFVPSTLIGTATLAAF